MHKRNQVIDRLKGLGMLFVVGGHSGSPFTGYYYTFHMGLFFFISGFLMLKSNYRSIEFKSFLRHKIIKVIVPFIIFCLVSLGVSEWRLYKMSRMFFPIESGHIKALFLGGGYLADYSINFPLWFFHTLFIAYVCMFFLIKLNRNLKIFVFILMYFITIPFQTVVPGRPIFHINVLPAALVYMLFGYGLHELLNVINKKIHISFGIVLLFIGWYTSRTYGGNIAQIGSLYYYFESFCTISGLYVILDHLKSAKILEYIGERSMFILGCHILVLERASEFVEYIKQSVGFYNDFIWHVFTVCITVILCCSFSDIFKITSTPPPYLSV